MLSSRESWRRRVDEVFFISFEREDFVELFMEILKLGRESSVFNGCSKVSISLLFLLTLREAEKYFCVQSNSFSQDSHSSLHFIQSIRLFLNGFEK